MVANLAYLQHGDARSRARTSSSSMPPGIPSPSRIAIAAATSAATATVVKNIRQQTAQTVSSITTVDLRGISRIEEAFALVLAAAAMALFVGVGLAERRQELATMAALGALAAHDRRVPLERGRARARRRARARALLGWLLAEMLVAMLQHVFDPPPDHLARPGRFLAGLAGAACSGRRSPPRSRLCGIGSLPLGAILREE